MQHILISLRRRSPAKSGKTYQNQNWQIREVVAEYPLRGREDAREAVQAAQKSFPTWSALTSVARGRIFSKASQILESRKPQLAEALTREEGKTLVESQGEVQRAIDIFRFFGGLSYTLGGDHPARLPHNLLYTVRQPLGVAALITPIFPSRSPPEDRSAPISGNSVVIKPASQAPGPT
jgi:aldehyde dehydrogenase (NAD+)